MFGSLTHLIPASSSEPPKDIPPPTPVNFPRCHPQVPDDDEGGPDPETRKKHLTSVLQSIIRPTDVGLSHFEALGVHVTLDTPVAELIPGPSFIPDFDAWHALSADEAYADNESTRRRLNTGNLSPGCKTYLERKRELSIVNEAAYRAVRRVPAPKGQSQARLGNSFEFFRHLELFSGFWDDTSKPTSSSKPRVDESNKDNEKGENTGASSTTEDNSDKVARTGTGPGNAVQDVSFHRTRAGHQMPPEYRHNMITAFLKLVAYDFGCNVSAPRTEPRLHVTHTPQVDSPPSAVSPRSSYFSSGCTFIFRTPTTREAARAGVVEGPLAAMSARHTTSFPPARAAPAPPSADTTTESCSSSVTTATDNTISTDKDSALDLARELVAALITAQHRAREGRTEKRVGEGAWWTTKPRWGGGSGGPIGREIDMQSASSPEDALIGDKDEPPSSSSSSSSTSSPAYSGAADISLPRRPGGSSSIHVPASRPSMMGGPYSLSTLIAASSSSSSSSGRGEVKGAKRLKKSTPGNPGGTLPMYDNYRMVRPPAATWDKRTKYAAIGRARGVDYDDIFVISGLFHHISIVRVRVPDRLLAVLDGEPDDDDNRTQKGKGGKRSWGRLEVRRSPWYDFFKVDERIAAMQLVWSMMAYLMREEQEQKEEAESKRGGDKDVKMGNS
ncbi:hypothetical protein QBC46DRAFT_448928 [Diplogelasinospora grovesii]|uniref:Uncharacterized protein n=1 Tax=Diplogelasinospora grovesii TaxID=303347 RepID=A0AAN6N8M1_9PEZI|nr:hypothetical protein QBC46DRAFT_448928 [Diplogelasinospora grovesii]